MNKGKRHTYAKDLLSFALKKGTENMMKTEKITKRK